VRKGSKLYYYDTYSRHAKELTPTFLLLNPNFDIFQPDQRDREQDFNTDICGVLAMAWLTIFDKYGSRKAMMI
jgi:hypothetical protein